MKRQFVLGCVLALLGVAMLIMLVVKEQMQLAAIFQWEIEQLLPFVFQSLAETFLLVTTIVLFAVGLDLAVRAALNDKESK